VPVLRNPKSTLRVASLPSPPFLPLAVTSLPHPRVRISLCDLSRYPTTHALTIRRPQRSRWPRRRGGETVLGTTSKARHGLVRPTYSITGQIYSLRPFHSSIPSFGR
jgi:hypothetical protein